VAFRRFDCTQFEYDSRSQRPHPIGGPSGKGGFSRVGTVLDLSTGAGLGRDLPDPEGAMPKRRESAGETGLIIILVGSCGSHRRALECRRETSNG
jgi:hypothetical protein